MGQNSLAIIMPVFRTGLFILFIASYCFAQNSFPDTLMVAVTFYDFHADNRDYDLDENPGQYVANSEGSCPEFETHKRRVIGRVLNMVAGTLDSDRKPVKGANPFFNEFIHTWFRPWPHGNDTHRPVYAIYDAQNPAAHLVSIDSNGPDTSFKNMVFNDSLPFIHQGNGVYQYDNQNFFPLDNKGFGNEPYIANKMVFDQAQHWNPDNPRELDHNYGFTMELHRQFEYVPGQTFSFRGDDDVWVFVDGKKVMDIGGIHGPITDQFSVDALGLAPGKNYAIDFFYAERHTGGSTIKITTNLFQAFVNALELHTDAADTVVAGTVISIHGVLKDNKDSVRTEEFGHLIQWSTIESASAATAIHDSGATLSFSAPTRAYQSLTIQADFVHEEWGHLSAQKNIYIGPAEPDHIVIEKDSDSTRNLWADDPVDTIRLKLTDTAAYAFAVMRDSYQNWAGVADQAIWQAAKESVIAVNSAQGQKEKGVIARGGKQANLSADTVSIAALQASLRQGTATVIIDNFLKCATPQAHPPGQSYAASLRIDSLTSATENASIWYCVDCPGDPSPDDPNSIRYEPSQTIAISAPGKTIIKAIAVKNEPGWLPSDIMVESYINVDSLGPQIQKIIYYAGSPPWEEKNDPDTLVIFFSEPVMADELLAGEKHLWSIFDYAGYGQSVDENMLFEGASFADKPLSGDTVASITIVLAGKNQVQPLIDSASIQPGSLFDVAGNPSRQEDKQVAWGREYDIFISAIPNPFSLSTSEIPPAFLAQIDIGSNSRPDNKSVVIEAKSIKPIVYENSSVAIYDAVGNRVTEELPGYERVDSQGYRSVVFFWNARNRNGRAAGTGTYLAIIVVARQQDSGSERRETRKVRIGIRQ